MNGLTQTAADDLPEDSEILALTDDENPLKFLNSSEEHLPLAMISGIDDMDRLEGYRLAEQRYFDPPRDVILEALTDRECKLNGDEITVDTTTDPVPATDGGTTFEYDENDSEDSAEPDDVHPDVNGLAAGEVRTIDRDRHTVYIWPATPDADAPYILREYAEDKQHIEETLSQSELFDWIQGDSPDSRTNAEIDVQPSANAATGGSDQ